jgi:type I restriction enzyme S subunit
MFLYYLLKYKKDAIEAMGSGTTFKEVSGSTMRRIEVRVPVDKKEQERISAILDALDSKIEANDRINDNLQEQAATIFSEWLRSCSERISIGELSNNILDYTPITNKMVRLLNSSDVTEGVFPKAPLVPNADLKGHFKKRFQFDDILYSEIRPRNHHYGYVLFDASEYIASTRLMVIRAIPTKVSPALLYQYLLLPEVEAEFTLKTESRSGTFPQGNYADMASIMVPYSSIESQSEVSAILSQIRKTIALNQLENQRLEEMRDALLPRLMSGEIDVTDIEI